MFSEFRKLNYIYLKIFKTHDIFKCLFIAGRVVIKSV